MRKWKTENDKRKIWINFFFVAIFLLLPVFFLPVTAGAQEDELPNDVAPPPLKIFSLDEKRQLEAEKNVKKRTQLSLDLMEARLVKAEKLAAENFFRESLNEAVAFQALLENSLDYLNRSDTGGGKIDGNFKRLEIYLRRQAPRLEILRRAMPYKYGYYVQKIQKFVRQARAKAIEPLFDEAVVTERKP